MEILKGFFVFLGCMTTSAVLVGLVASFLDIGDFRAGFYTATGGWILFYAFILCESKE